MPYHGDRRRTCAICKRPRQDGEIFSARGKCEKCAHGRIRANGIQLRLGAGPYYKRWKAALIASLDAVPADDKRAA